MSEYDRGAYTPPTEEPFAFDARATRVKRPAPAMLLGSIVVLVVLVGSVALFYWSGVRGAGETPQVVGKPQLRIKSPPPIAEAKPATEDPGKLDVYDSEKGQVAPPATKPAFAPPPEQPSARVAAETTPPPPGAKVEAPPPAAKAAPAPVEKTPPPVRVATGAPPRPAQPAPVAAKATTHAKHKDAVGELLASSEETPAKPTKAAKLAKAPAAEPAAPPADAAHAVMVQIGAFSSTAIADAEFAKTKSAFATFTVGKKKHVEKADVNGRIYYRAAFAGFDKAGAKAFCKALLEAKKACILK